MNFISIKIYRKEGKKGGKEEKGKEKPHAAGEEQHLLGRKFPSTCVHSKQARETSKRVTFHLHLCCLNLLLCYYRSKPPLCTLRNQRDRWSVLHPDVYWGPRPGPWCHTCCDRYCGCLPIPIPLFLLTEYCPWLYARWQCALLKGYISQSSLQPRVANENQAANHWVGLP